MSEVLASLQAASSVMALSLSALAGAILGALFFGGLRWTTRRAAMSAMPALWFLGSLVLRMGAALWGFWVIADGRWERMLMCLLGFVVARVFVLRLRWLPTQPSLAHDHTAPQEVHHAPQP